MFAWFVGFETFVPTFYEPAFAVVRNCFLCKQLGEMGPALPIGKTMLCQSKKLFCEEGNGHSN